jgi:CheY-like chemotaxis protein
MAEQALDILIVEDNPGDARLISEAFKEKRSAHRLVHVTDGQAAIDYLHSAVEEKENRPALILLDLNLPRLHGREVLADIKKHPQLKSIPVVVFTTSRAPEDIQQIYDLNANCYVTKPGDLDHFLEVVGVIQDFWLKTVQLPA